jgi:hypothetical protein
MINTRRLAVRVSGVKAERRRRRSRCGVGHVVNPAGVFQALREQSGMSTPIRATLVDNSARTNHLLSEQVFKEDWGIALWA